LCGIASKGLASPIGWNSRFYPATKAQAATTSTSPKGRAELVGKRVPIASRAIMLPYAEGSYHAESCGIIVADTKFEFGLVPVEDGDGRPAGSHHSDRRSNHAGSSRFWPQDSYSPGGAQKSFDKQFVRDYLDASAAQVVAGRCPPTLSKKRARNTSKPIAASPGTSWNNDQRPARKTCRRNGRQGRALR
jgi:phosphoribosylaminoimidazole-succinocarboxamide synthase